MVKERLPKTEQLSYEFESRLKSEVKKYEGIPIAISGGMDSGTLASFVKPEFAISVDLPGGERYDEGQYARTIARHLSIRHLVVKPDPEEFDEGVKEAVRSIGKPTAHFNIYPLWAMYKRLNQLGVKEVILGDGPDETQSGYSRNLIMDYLYKVKDFDAFRNYYPVIDKVLPEPYQVYAKLVDREEEEVRLLMEGHSLIQGMNRVDMALKRVEMDEMSNGIASGFGIKNIRPYQDNPVFDQWQFNFPDSAKIHKTEFGKYALRLLAQRRIPHDLAWRKTKVGGPVWPVNQQKGWMEVDGEFGKQSWIDHQQEILDTRGWGR